MDECGVAADSGRSDGPNRDSKRPRRRHTPQGGLHGVQALPRALEEPLFGEFGQQLVDMSGKEIHLLAYRNRILACEDTAARGYLQELLEEADAPAGRLGWHAGILPIR